MLPTVEEVEEEAEEFPAAERLNTYIIFEDSDNDDDKRNAEEDIRLSPPPSPIGPMPRRMSSKRQKLNMARMASSALREEQEPRVLDV